MSDSCKKSGVAPGRKLTKAPEIIVGVAITRTGFCGPLQQTYTKPQGILFQISPTPTLSSVLQLGLQREVWVRAAGQNFPGQGLGPA